MRLAGLLQGLWDRTQKGLALRRPGEPGLEEGRRETETGTERGRGKEILEDKKGKTRTKREEGSKETERESRKWEKG